MDVQFAQHLSAQFDDAVQILALLHGSDLGPDALQGRFDLGLTGLLLQALEVEVAQIT